MRYKKEKTYDYHDVNASESKTAQFSYETR